VSGNSHPEAARRYHDATMHSPQSVRSSAHRLDWDTKPGPFKIYPDLPVVALPRDFPVPAQDALPAISGEPPVAGTVDIERLAALLFFTAGVTKQKTYPGGGIM
jgi:hypothetical protein